MTKKHRYKHAEGKRWIEVRVKTSQQLFDARDPAPFRERDLDDHFVQYITSTAREFPHKSPLKIVIYIEEKESESLSYEGVREAIQSYWTYQIELFDNDLKVFFKRAQLFMLIGLLVLVSCITAAQSIAVIFLS